MQLELYVLIYWWKRFILAPLGLSAPIKLYHDAGNAQIPQKDGKPRTLLDMLVENCPSLIGRKAWYSPSFWLFGSGHFQTAYSALGNFTKVHILEYERKFLAVPDGGVICVDITPPLHAEPADSRPILVCMHGLTGGSHESYIRSVLAVLTKPIEQGGKGWRGIVVTSRGCGNSPLTTPKLYHVGATYDLKSAMLYIANVFPGAPVYGIGFSLGAGMITRYIGTESESSQMKTAIAVGAPWDLMIGHIELQASMLGLIYSQAMAKNLQRLFQKHVNVFKSHPKIDAEAVLDNPNMTLYEFDSLVTRILGGFNSTEHYYRSMSPRHFVKDIKIPFLALNAVDDPIAASRGIPFESVKTNPNLVFAMTKHGGHLGWFSGPFAFITKERWVVKPIIEWLEMIHNADPAPKSNSGVRKPRMPKVGDEMVVDPDDPECGLKEIGEETVIGGDDPGEESTLVQGL